MFIVFFFYSILLTITSIIDDYKTKINEPLNEERNCNFLNLKFNQSLFYILNGIIFFLIQIVNNFYGK